MCRIDASFDVSSLDEKKDPVERFIQALDESKAEGKYRDLLIKHYSENWIDFFYNASNLEESLSCAKEKNSEPEKCIAFLLSQKRTITNSILRSFKMYNLTVNDSVLIGYLKDVAQTYHPSSPYGLFNDGMNKIEGNYFLFVSWLYGNDFCLSKEFFDDKSLNSLDERERTGILWDYFESLAHPFKNFEYFFGKTDMQSEFTRAASLSLISGPPTEHSLAILQGISYINAWIKLDSQAGRLRSNFGGLFNNIYSTWEQIKSLFLSEVTDCEKVIGTLIKWLDDTKLEFEKLLYVSADLNNASEIDIDEWARGLDVLYGSICSNIICDYDYDQLTSDELNLRLSNAFDEICSQLTSLQIVNWIKYSVKDDFQIVLKSNQNSLRSFNSMGKWINKEHFDTLLSTSLESLNDLELESQLLILSVCTPNMANEFYSKYLAWGDELLSNLIEKDDFPKGLIPDWTVIAIGKLDHEKLLPYIDKSIGILRSELTKNENSEELMNSYHKQLEKLLPSINNSSPTKILRHRLQLMRSSIVPFSDESISTGDHWNKEGLHQWYSSLRSLVDDQFSYQVSIKKIATSESYSQVRSDFYMAFSYELAEFCLSRLRLRKGEKAKDGKYDSSQVVEQSSIWRQGYLKVLIEFGFDLNGKVHKTVNFTKKSDPNKDVRAIASECYKAVRRHAKKSQSIQDIKRSIIAAEWWLLMCQRRELGLKINDDEALKTRRNLMRNP